MTKPGKSKQTTKIRKEADQNWTNLVNQTKESKSLQLNFRQKIEFSIPAKQEADISTWCSFVATVGFCLAGPVWDKPRKSAFPHPHPDP